MFYKTYELSTLFLAFFTTFLSGQNSKSDEILGASDPLVTNKVIIN